VWIFLFVARPALLDTADDTLEKDRVSCARLSDLPRLLLCSFDVIPGPSGSSRRLTEYLKALPDRFSVVVLSAKTPDHSHIEKYQGARLLRVPVGSGDLVSRIQTFERAVRRQLDSEEYALAHFTDPFGGYVLCEMKGDYGYRLIYDAQTFPSQELRYTHPQTEGDKRFLAKVRRQELFCLMNADLVITGSQTTRTYIQSLGASTEQTRVIRSPVDLGPYTPDVLGVPDGQPMRLMYLGSQAGWQGLPILLRALALAVEQGAQVKLTLVGARHPDWQPHLEDMAKELGVQEHVEFQPPVLHDDLVKVLALADVGVLPLDDVDRNRLQGGPLAKVSEYFAAGRPVLAADLPVTRELLPASAVVFHTAGDARSLADSIVELSRDVPRRLALGREARAFAEETLEAGLIRGKLLDIYDELLGKQRATATGSANELPAPTMTGTPTNRLSQLKPPEGGGRRSSRGKSSEKGKSEKGKSKRTTSRDDLPLVLGQALSDDAMDTRLIKTEPDMRSNEPPVVMGRPLRDRAPTEASPSEEFQQPTPVVRPPAGLRRDEPEEPPTSIVTAMAPERDTSDRTPTPIVRSPLGTSSEAPPAAASRAPIPVPEEEPPAPTPIVPIKSLVGANGTGASRSEPAPSKPPMSPSTSKTGSRSALQEPARGPESSEKGRATSLPPLTRSAPPPAETKGTPPRLEPTAPPIVRTPVLPPEPVTPPIVRTPVLPPEPVTPPIVRASPAPEPVAPPSPRTPPPLEPAAPASPRTPPPLRTSGVTPSVATPPPVVAHEEEPEEISEEEAQEISDEAPLDAAPTPTHPQRRMEEPEDLSHDELEEADAADAVEASDDELREADAAEAVEASDDQLEEADAEAVEAADDELPNADDQVQAADDAVEEVDSAEAIDAPEEASADHVQQADDAIEPVGDDPKEASPAVAAAVAVAEPAPLLEPPDSALDPWFAQLAHGYCPPEGAQFARHTPPTNVPGRDEEPTDPSRVPPSPLIQGASRGKGS
jgi:glycosyltransferase involved in cell wall biosynthesis